MTKLTRREILRLGALAGVSAAALPLIEACSPGVGSASTTAPAATTAVALGTPAPITGNLKVMAWNSATDQRQACINEFMKEYPGVAVELVSYPSATWQQQLTATFVAGTPIVDAGIIKEEIIGSWIAAGFLQPMDGLPGLDNIKKAMYPGPAVDCTYNGKTYGLPYYANFSTWFSNKKMLNAAGISAPPKTWDELKAQAQQIKKAGILNTPVIMGFKPGSTVYFDFWTMVYASGGNLFDQNDDPVFDGADTIPLEILNRIVDLRQSGLLDPKSIELEIPDILTALKAGTVAMAPTLVLYALDLGDAATSKVVSDWSFSNVPSLNGTMKNTSGFTRQYVLGAKTTQLPAAWQFLSFMAFQDKSGGYFAPTYLMTQAALLSGLAPVMDSAPVKTAMQKLYGDQLPLVTAQQALAKPRQGLKTTWFAQWDAFNQQTLQDVVAGKTSASDGLKASAKKARDLKKG
jgi:multiple sugar transport system substrate-binding protein